ncbi:MAG: DUF5808 domain-containing protein [Bacillota bacterium]
MSSDKYYISAIAIVIALLIIIRTYFTKKKLGNVENEADSWKLGIFYYNPLDKRIFLPKRSGLGATLNFANPVSIILIVGIIVAGIFFG